MAQLVFEVWHDPVAGSFELADVSAEHDRVRQFVSPDAALVYTFTAASTFAAMRHYNTWQGWGTWLAPDGLSDQDFTAAEAEAQRQYLAERAAL